MPLDPGRSEGVEKDRFPTVAVAVILILAVWLARFYYSPRFGLYEDDPSRIIQAMESSWSEIPRMFWNLLSSFGGQGRPLHPALIHLFAYWGAKLAGLRGAYSLALLIVSLNAILLYALMKKVSGHQTLALTTALAYCVFPADTTQAYLTIAFGGQPSITFFLVAAHCYFSRWRPLSYPIALGSLICYETVFPLFLAVPLLAAQWDWRLARRVAWQGLFVGGALAGAALLRVAVGEHYVTSLNLATALTRPLRQMIVGPLTSLAMIFYRPWHSLPGEITGNGVLFGVILAGSAALLSLVSSRAQPVERVGLPAWRLARLSGAGLAMLMLAYPITFTVRASVIDGRDTRVHMAAAIGTAILFGAGATALLGMRRLRSLAVGTLALLLTGAIAFGFSVQGDYVTAWAYQQSFWSDVVRLCPDLGKNTVILVEESRLRTVRQISPWGWDMWRFLLKMYVLPEPRSSTPVVFTLRADWRKIVAESGNLLDGVQLKGLPLPAVENPAFVFLQAEGGQLTRAAGPLVVGDHRFELLPVVPPGAPDYPTRVLHELLIVPKSRQVQYLTP